LNHALLSLEVQEFINSNLNSDITKLLLKGSPFKTMSIKDLVEQIEAKKKCETKLPLWYKTPNIYYPNKLNIEQTSSETSAAYKAQLIKGATLIDLTGGFGIDTYYFSKNFSNVTHCELNTGLSAIVKHNYKQLAATNTKIVNQDGLVFLETSKTPYDWIYVDPSRRHDSKGKVFFLKDCLPNIPEHLKLLFSHTNNIMLKTSPLLDLSVGISELQHVKTIHIVAINNEVKELLWILENNYSDEIIIKTVNIKKDTQEKFEFKLVDEISSQVNFSFPLSYLYEPNSAILKAGAFKSVASNLELFKLHKHSHLYTSNTLVDFPGRRFKILSCVPYSKKLLKKESIEKANITTRNFPDSVESIRKKFGIKEGGHKYVFFTTSLLDKKYVIFTEKI
jgi:hypothetical protein